MSDLDTAKIRDCYLAVVGHLDRCGFTATDTLILALCVMNLIKLVLRSPDVMYQL